MMRKILLALALLAPFSAFADQPIVLDSTTGKNKAVNALTVPGALTTSAGRIVASRSVSSSGTLTSSDHHVDVTATSTQTLPATPSNGRLVTVCDRGAGAGNVAVAANTGQTLAGASSYAIPIAGTCVSLRYVSASTDWQPVQATDNAGALKVAALPVAAAGSVATTDSTATTCLSWTPPDGATVMVQLYVGAWRTDVTGAGAGFAGLGTFRRSGSTTTSIAVNVGTIQTDTLFTPTVTMDANGSAVRVRVAGLLGESIQWGCRIAVTDSSLAAVSGSGGSTPVTGFVAKSVTTSSAGVTIGTWACANPISAAKVRGVLAICYTSDNGTPSFANTGTYHVGWVVGSTTLVSDLAGVAIVGGGLPTCNATWSVDVSGNLSASTCNNSGTYIWTCQVLDPNCQ